MYELHRTTSNYFESSIRITKPSIATDTLVRIKLQTLVETANVVKNCALMKDVVKLIQACGGSVHECGQGSQFDSGSYLQTMCANEASAIIWAKT